MADKKNTTSFLAYNYPALQAGAFLIGQEIVLPSNITTDKNEIPVAKQHFVVAGERFSISPDHVFATFPPKDSNADYTGCLPHIELKRSTFPWERNAAKEQDNSNTTRMPWLALLLVSDDDIDKKRVVPATVAIDDKYFSRVAPSPDPVPVENIETLNILKCSKAYLDECMPAPEELKLLVHVRKVSQKDEVAMANLPEERAVIVSRSMPLPGNNYTAHLVSLEERYTGGKFKYQPDADQLDWVVSLYSWRFTAIDNESYKPDALALAGLQTLAAGKSGIEKKQLEQLYAALNKNLSEGNAPLLRSNERFKTYIEEEAIFPAGTDLDAIITPAVLKCFQYEAASLRALLNNLDTGPLTLALPATATNNDSVKNYLDFGSVPLPHSLRAGGNTVSWYRGPFVAYDAQFDDDHGKIHTYQHADELIQFNKDTGLLDMTYAAAWELGRLMFINEPKLVQRLQLWKQENNFDDLLEQQRKEHAHLAGFLAQPKKEKLPESIVRFLLQSFRLINFPFNYLVPDHRLLPAESLRFFKVDQVWLRSFMYGVISVGERISLEKTNNIILDMRRELRKQIDSIIKEKDCYTNEENAIYGVLIHSDAVSGWPALQADAYHHEPGGQKKQIALLHKSYLSDDVMLCLFYGKIEQIVLYLPMEAAHFGFDWNSESKSYSKTRADGKTPVKAFTANTINATALAAELSVTASGNFAVELLQRQEMVMVDVVVK